MSTPTPTKTGKDELRALRSLLISSIDAILDSATDIPSLNAPHPLPLAPTPDIGTALAASAQITAILEGPTAAGRLAMSLHVPASLRVAIDAHAAEAIRENGDPAKGLHVTEIAKASNINPAKLARVLRLLASQHIFRETSEDTFVNNRLSVGLDTFSPLSSLINNKSYHTGSLGIQAFLCHTTDEVMKASAYLSEHLQDPTTTNDDDPTVSAFTRSVNVKALNAWEWFNLPGNEFRLERFGMGMKGLQMIAPTAAFDVGQGFDFAQLADQAKVVDVGGGVGSVSLAITKAFGGKLRVINQDRPEVIEGEAKAFWAKEHPDALSSGRVALQAHDFFEPQPIKDASVFLLRQIIHDWADTRAISILAHLRQAAQSETKLIVVEQLIQPLCAPEQLSVEEDVPGAGVAQLPQAPYPLLPTGGSPMAYLADLQMMAGLNAQERTVAQFKKLGEQSGWKLERIFRPAGGVGFNQIVFGTA